MSQTMLYQDIVKPGMAENESKYLQIMAKLKNAEETEKEISKGIQELVTKRSEKEHS